MLFGMPSLHSFTFLMFLLPLYLIIPLCVSPLQEEEEDWEEEGGEDGEYVSVSSSMQDVSHIHNTTALNAHSTIIMYSYMYTVVSHTRALFSK